MDFWKTFARAAMFFAALVLAMIIPCQSVFALVGDADGPFGLDGSMRFIGAHLKNYEYEPLFNGDDEDGVFQGILRLTAAGRPSDFFSFEIHGLGDVTYDSRRMAEANMLGVQSPKTRYRYMDAKAEWLDEDYTSGNLWFDRMNAKFTLPYADVTIGRQAITFGKAYFWNPLDVFLPFDPAQFDRDYKPGVDGLRVDVPLGDFSGITLVGVAGRELNILGQYVQSEETFGADWYGSAVMGRFFTNYEGWDLAVQGGKIYGGFQLGGALVGEIAGIQIRMEAAQFWAQHSPGLPYPYRIDLFEDHITAVIGAGYHFENNIDLNFEFLYNDGGETEDLEIGMARLQMGSVMHAGRFLAGLQASMEITPLIVGQLAAIHSISDGSTQVQPTLSWSLGDNADLILGATFNLGRRPTGNPLMMEIVQIHSEFGAYSDKFFAEFKYYF